MSDIVERLRRWAISTDAVPASDLMDEAATEIERLSAYRDEAEAETAVARLLVDRLRLTEAEREAVEWYAAWVHEVVPLYRSPTLTDAEREAVERVSVAYDLLPTEGAQQVSATLRGLLERLA